MHYNTEDFKNNLKLSHRIRDRHSDHDSKFFSDECGDAFSGSFHSLRIQRSSSR